MIMFIFLASSVLKDNAFGEQRDIPGVRECVLQAAVSEFILSTTRSDHDH